MEYLWKQDIIPTTIINNRAMMILVIFSSKLSTDGSKMDNIVIQKLKTGRTCYFEESLVVTDTICGHEITFVL